MVLEQGTRVGRPPTTREMWTENVGNPQGQRGVQDGVTGILLLAPRGILSMPDSTLVQHFPLYV